MGHAAAVVLFCGRRDGRTAARIRTVARQRQGFVAGQTGVRLERLRRDSVSRGARPVYLACLRDDDHCRARRERVVACAFPVRSAVKPEGYAR